MSISLVTRGRLWPAKGGLIIREQFVDIHSTIVDPWTVTIEMEEIVEITASVVLDPEISASVVVEDRVTDEVEALVDVSSEVEDC